METIMNKSFFLLGFIFCIYKYGSGQLFHNVLLRLYNYWYIINEQQNQEQKKHTEALKVENIERKNLPKYEDKFLTDVRKMDKEWVFTEDEKKLKESLINDFIIGYKATALEKINEINKYINSIELSIKEDSDIIIYETLDEHDNACVDEDMFNELNKQKKEEIKKQTTKRYELNKLLETTNLKKEAEEHATSFIIKKRLENLENSLVIEKTPIGNVLMIYNASRESFKYYSDCNIPYRYLEVVCRKYVKTFNCRPIYIDIEEELRIAEDEIEKQKELKKIKDDEDKKVAEEITKNTLEIPVQPNKNVFAKFKSYNKNAGGKISMAAPPKNSIPNNNLIDKKEDESMVIKTNANRYTYEGKFSNYNFLKKVEQKVFNKRLGCSFADFKKMKKK